MTTLTLQQLEVLDFEDAAWTYIAVKDALILERFGFNSTRYFLILNHVIDQPAADHYAPALVRRLRDLRARRAYARSHRRLLDVRDGR